MNILKKQDGIALVTSLVLTMLTLSMIMVLMTFVLQGIRTSGATKRYANSMEAAYGGAELVAKELIPYLLNFVTASSMEGTYADIQLRFLPDNPTKADACLTQKLNNVTGSWDPGVCGAQMTDPDPKVGPDMQFNLSPNLVSFGFTRQAGYNVYAKIIDTAVAGNTYKARSDFETKSPGGEREGSSPAAIPSLYTIEITGEPQNNPVERVRLEVLYSY